MNFEDKIAAVVILYHPPAEVVENIKSYCDFVETIFVFDNTDKAPYIKDSVETLPKVGYYHNNENEGISKRLNKAAELAIAGGYRWLLTMDQDTRFSEDAIQTYLQCFRSYANKLQVGAFGTAYSNKIIPVNGQCLPEDTENLITSGMLLNLQLFSAIGKFDENLFIDSVDHDYCIRAKIAGFSTIKFANVSIEHALGEEVYRSSIKSLFLVKKRKVVHSPLRCYYLYRNMLYLAKKYKNENTFYAKQIKTYALSSIKASLLYGRDALNVMRYLRMAKRDFKNNKMGKIREGL